jgi:hypothetical protein
MYLWEVILDLQIIIQYHGTEVADNCLISSRTFQITVKAVTYHFYAHTQQIWLNAVTLGTRQFWIYSISACPQILNIYTPHSLHLSFS